MALLIVAVTAATVAWAVFRPKRLRFQRTTHCGCSSQSRQSMSGSILYRARKGQPPSVIVKMK